MVATVAENAGALGLKAPEIGPMNYETIFRTSLWGRILDPRRFSKSEFRPSIQKAAHLQIPK